MSVSIIPANPGFYVVLRNADGSVRGQIPVIAWRLNSTRATTGVVATPVTPSGRCYSNAQVIQMLPVSEKI